VRTVYLLERIALGERRLPCRRGVLFVGDPHSCWHAVIYDSEPGALEGFVPGQVLPMGAITPDEVWLEGLARLASGDGGVGVHYLEGVGPLMVGGDVEGRLAATGRRPLARMGRIA
jgi:hypothetical protein